MEENKNNLGILFGLLATLFVVFLLIIVLLFAAKKARPATQEAKQASAPVTQTQPAKEQTSKTDSSDEEFFNPPVDEEMAAQIKKLFEPIFSEGESARIGRLYAAEKGHVRIKPDLFNDLRSQHFSEEEQAKYQQSLAAHEQALEILRQHRAAKGEQPSENSVSGLKELHLPGLDAIRSLQGQPQIDRREVACPEREIGFKWNKICQEIQFADGTKSIVYVIVLRGVTARDDFDANGNLLTRRDFATKGGYFDPKKIAHIPNYPEIMWQTIFYDTNSTANKIERYAADNSIEEEKQDLQQKFASRQPMPEIIVQSFRNAPTYCDLYPTECIPL